MRVVLVIAALVLVAGATACGGDGNDGNDASDSRRSERDIQAEAQRRAESILLELSDFPDGWRGSPSDDEEDEENSERFRSCIGVDFSSLTITGEADSNDFKNEDTTEASSEATVLESEDEAREGFDQFAEGMDSAGAEDCFRELFESGLEPNDEVKLTDIDLGQLNVPAPEGVAEADAWQLVLEVEGTSGEGEGISVGAYLDYVQMYQGDCVTSVQLYDVFTPFDSDLRNELVQKVADRMAAECSASE